ncbi:hypothetical protein [Halococcus hamelinensis]|uniref:hypothetical protein n=1 Tax=Halococcus hamelinensis TaxID=332168 RepID=UPI000ACFB1E7|nr:hypothetical protein [Halococcus hamelinensis]
MDTDGSVYRGIVVRVRIGRNIYLDLGYIPVVPVEMLTAADKSTIAEPTFSKYEQVVRAKELLYTTVVPEHLDYLYTHTQVVPLE